MNKQREFQTVAELARPLQRLQALRAKRAAGRHDLDSDDDVAVGFDGFLDFFLIDQTRISENAVARPRHSAQRRKVDVIEHARFGIVRDVVAKHIQESMPRTARVHDRRYAGADAENIRVHAKSPKPFHQMKMNVN